MFNYKRFDDNILTLEIEFHSFTVYVSKCVFCSKKHFNLKILKRNSTKFIKMFELTQRVFKGKHFVHKNNKIHYSFNQKMYFKVHLGSFDITIRDYYMSKLTMLFTLKCSKYRYFLQIFRNSSVSEWGGFIGESELVPNSLERRSFGFGGSESVAGNVAGDASKELVEEGQVGHQPQREVEQQSPPLRKWFGKQGKTSFVRSN